MTLRLLSARRDRLTGRGLALAACLLLAWPGRSDAAEQVPTPAAAEPLRGKGTEPAQTNAPPLRVELSDDEERTLATLTPLLPPSASARGSTNRQLLVFSPATNQSHAAVGAYGAIAIRLLGQRHRIFTATLTQDASALQPENLSRFDALVLNNTFGECLGEEPWTTRRAEAILDFVKNGKGLVGIHGAAVAPNWQNPPANRTESDYRLMLGGVFDRPVSMSAAPELRVEDPLNQVCAVLEGRDRYPLPFQDEIIQLKSPYSRDHLRVLLSADMGALPHQGTRADGDYPVAWLKGFDQGRVFFFALGHSPATFNDPNMLRLLQDGIQYALGDLPANDLPK